MKQSAKELLGAVTAIGALVLLFAVCDKFGWMVATKIAAVVLLIIANKLMSK